MAVGLLVYRLSKKLNWGVCKKGIMHKGAFIRIKNGCKFGLTRIITMAKTITHNATINPGTFLAAPKAKYQKHTICILR